MTSLAFRLKRVDQTINCLLVEIKHNNLMREMYKIVCRASNYFKHFLIFISAVSGFVLISEFTSLLSVPVDIASSAVGMKNCAVPEKIKKYQSLIRKKGRI